MSITDGRLLGPNRSSEEESRVRSQTNCKRVAKCRSRNRRSFHHVRSGLHSSSSHSNCGHLMESTKPFRISRRDAIDLSQDDIIKIRVLYSACFPGEEEPGETAEDFMSRITFLHNPEECVWFLLWIPGPEGEILAGMATTAPYHASLYGFNLAVAPRHQGIGYGRRLMHETQAYALTQGLTRVSATVDASRPRLLAYYVALGAEIVNTGMTAPGALRPPSVHIVRNFTREEVGDCIAQADAQIMRRSQRKLWWSRPSINSVAVCSILIIISATVVVNLRRTGGPDKVSWRTFI